MDIKQLRSFVHIAELGSLSRAAERLNLSQPALSRQLSLLEETLDTKLLERTGRGVKLTEAGQMLAERARVILSDLARLEARPVRPQQSGHRPCSCWRPAKCRDRHYRCIDRNS